MRDAPAAAGTESPRGCSACTHNGSGHVVADYLGALESAAGFGLRFPQDALTAPPDPNTIPAPGMLASAKVAAEPASLSSQPRPADLMTQVPPREPLLLEQTRTAAKPFGPVRQAPGAGTVEAPVVAAALAAAAPCL